MIQVNSKGEAVQWATRCPASDNEVIEVRELGGGPGGMVLARMSTFRRNTNEDQTGQRLRGRPGKGSALLHRSAGLLQEVRLQPGAVPLADRGLTRRDGRDRAAASA